MDLEYNFMKNLMTNICTADKIFNKTSEECEYINLVCDTAAGCETCVKRPTKCLTCVTGRVFFNDRCYSSCASTPVPTFLNATTK